MPWAMASPIPAVEPVTTAWRPDRSILMLAASSSGALPRWLGRNADRSSGLAAEPPQRASSRVAIDAHSSASGIVGGLCPARRYQ